MERITERAIRGTISPFSDCVVCVCLCAHVHAHVCVISNMNYLDKVSPLGKGEWKYCFMLPTATLHSLPYKESNPYWSAA